MKFTKLAIVVVLMFLIGIFLSSCDIVDNIILGKESDIKLLMGMQSGNIEQMKEALEEGANINEFSGFKISSKNPLWNAVLGDLDVATKFLVNNGADVNIPKEKNVTLLMYWANNSDFDYCELLIKNGAIVNKEDKDGYTALEFVLDHNSRITNEKTANKIISLFLENGAKYRPTSLKAALNSIHTGNPTKAMYSVIKRVTEGLINAGFKSELDPALEVAILGDMPKLNELIKQNKMKKEDEKQILFSVSAFGNVEALKLLKERGLNLELTDDASQTPLMIASNYGNLEVVKYLVNNGVNIEARTSDFYGNRSALNVALENDQYDVAIFD